MRPQSVKALRLHREFGDRWGIGECLLTLGHVAANGRDFERAREFAEQLTTETADEPDSSHGLHATWLLAWAHNGLGDRVRSRELYEDALARARAAGATNVQALALGSLASLAILERRPRDAISVLKGGAANQPRDGRPVATRSGSVQARARRGGARRRRHCYPAAGEWEDGARKDRRSTALARA
jgi:tetratricopeptide (TPR) repeat protein